MSNLLCLVLGHEWFDTVMAWHRWEDWAEPEMHLWEYRERICLRCQKNEAVKERELDCWNFTLDPEDPPSWHTGPETQYFGLPNEWIS